ncbi:translocation/assembly module TamB domain-containing protein [Halpernia sp.]|uniref:translocation/assembly module TamB domain-containing protein n=1 Tax=Halpernia sp. TaxID=2782209 RepID=UPI003A8EDB2A
MAKIENNKNNNSKKSEKSLSEQVGKKVSDVQKNVQKSVDEAKDLLKDAVEHPVETAKEFGNQAVKDVTSYTWWAKLLLILFWSVLGLVIIIFIAINLPSTKQWAANQALQMVNKDFKSEMSTESVSVNYFGNVEIKGLRIKDYKGLEFIKARELKANSDWISLIKNAISGHTNSLLFNDLKLYQADIKVITYKGDSISNFIRYIDLFESGKKNPNKPPFELNSRVEIVNSKVSITNRNHDGDEGKWLSANNVNLKIPILKVVGSNITARINNFSFNTKRWGKVTKVETFSTDFSISKKALILKDLTFNTDHSLLMGDIKFNLDPETGWEDFADKVRWEMNLKKGSQISGYDISYFVTSWDNYKPFAVSGQMTGPLNKFYLENFQIGNKQVAINTSTLKASRLLKGNFQIETNHLSTDLTYVDLKAMLPTFISEKMKNFADDFGRIKYNGAVKVTPKQIFVPKADLITGIGQARISNFYLEDFSTELPKFRGYAEVNNLNTAVITKQPQVGLLSGKFNLKGQSLDVNQMVLRTKSQISKVEIAGKEINNIYLDGILDHKTYKGIVNINDEQAKAKVNGFFDFSTSNLKANVLADISHLNISYFTGGKEIQNLSGIIDAKVSMTNLNDLILDANLKNVNFATSTQKFNIPNGDIKTYFENGKRIVNVNAPGAVDGEISGKFNLADLAGMIQNGINKVLAGNTINKFYRGQDFNFDFNVKQALVSYFEPNLRIPDGVKINGSFNGNSNNLIFNADASSFKYLMTKKEEISDADKALALANPSYKLQEKDLIKKDSAMIDGFSIKINTANLDQQLSANISRIAYNDNILKDISLTGRNENDKILHLSANFKLGSPEEEADGKLNNYAINLNQTTNSEGDYVFRFEPTEIKLNNVAWTIDASPELDNSITYRKKTKDFLIQNFRVFSDNSELLVKNAIFKSAKDFSAKGEVKNFEISKILAFSKSENSMDITGVANGTFDFEMDKSTLKPLVDLNVENIILNGQKMGNIVIDVKNSDSPNIFNVSAKVLSSDTFGNNTLNLTGTINNNTKSPTLNLVAEMDQFDLAFTQEFVKTIFGNVRGKATGNLKISGSLADVDYSGDIALKNFGLKLLFTGVDYSFDDTVIPLSKGLAVLNDIGVHDGRGNSSGNISGAIQFQTLASMGVNLVMRADNLLLLDTQQKDFDLFWGRVYGKGDLFVDGPVSALNISTPNMTTLKNSTFTFNSNSTSNVEEFKMLRFLEEDKMGTVKVEDRKKYGANMNVDFTLDVDKGTTVNVLVGDDVGDISVRGEADDLKFNLSRNGNISMNGKYLVDNGTFVSKAILNRTFQIEKNSSIEWDGNALAPVLDIKANYLRTVTNAGEYLNVGSLQPINVLLTTKISGTLNNPKINLDVSAPDVSSQIKETLAAKMSQEDEKVLQFGSILVLNSFNVENAGGFNINVGKTVENSGYNILFKQLGSVLNSISNQFQVDLNYIQGDEASNSGSRANAGLSFILSPRVTLKTGLGIPLSKSSDTNVNYLSGEGTVEYDFSKKNDGTRLLRFYSKPSNIGLLSGSNTGNPGANQSYGAGVVYSKSFNTIFKRTKKDKNKKVKNPEIKKDSIKIDSLR